MKKLVLGLIVASFAAFPATAHHDGERVKAGDITVSHAWTYENAATAHSSRVYLTIDNDGGETDRLVGASVLFAEDTALQGQAIDEQGVLSVREVSAIAIEPGQTVTLQPGALWIELESVQQAFEHGEHFHMTLSFENAGEVEVEVEVEAVDDHEDHDHDHDPST